MDHMEGRETTATVSRLLTVRLAIGLGALAFALNIAALVLVASAGHTAPEPGSGEVSCRRTLMR